MADSPDSDADPGEELFRLLAGGGRIKGKDMQKLAVTELVAAAAGGNLDKISLLIAAGVDINAEAGQKPCSNLQGLTALMTAVECGKAEALSLLLQLGADLNAITYRGTALKLAAQQEDTLFVRMLLEAGADVNLIVDRGPPDALSSAAKKGNVNAIRLLLEAGAEVNPENEDQNTNPLYYAASSRNAEAVRILLEAGSSIDVYNENDDNHTPLITAAVWKSVDIMRLLIAAGADVNKRTESIGSSTALAAASGHGKENRAETLQFLVSQGAVFNPDKDEAQRAIYESAEDGDMDSLLIFESLGVYIEPEFASRWGPRALALASRNGHVEAVKFLMAKGADIHADDGNGLTAVMQAGSQEILDILLSAGATIDADRKKRARALRIAALWGNTALIHALIKSGVNINAKEPWSLETPLIIAAVSKHRSVLPVLIAAGAKLEVRDGQGYTALTRAAAENNTYSVLLLVRAGANVNAANDNEPLTPLEHAVQKRNREMVRALVGAGAKLCELTEPYVQAMDSFIAAVLSVFPSDFPLILRQDILSLILEQHDGRFLTMPLQSCLETMEENLAPIKEMRNAPHHRSCLFKCAQVFFKVETKIVKSLIKVSTSNLSKFKSRRLMPRWMLRSGLYPRQDTSLIEELFRLLADGGHITSKALQDLAGEELVAAAADGNLDKVSKLIVAGVDKDAIGEQQPGKVGVLTALMAAVKFGHTEVASVLVHAGADVNIISEYHETALKFAAAQEDSVFVHMLLEAGADVNLIAESRWAETALAVASRSTVNRAEKLQILVAAGARFKPDSNEAGNTLFPLVLSWDMDSLRILESTGIYMGPEFSSDWGPEALAIASYCGRVEAAKFFIERGVDIHMEYDDGLTPVMYAGSQEVLDLLLDAGATISADGEKKAKALWQAAEYDRAALVRALLNAGVDVNAQDSADQTALIFAAMSGGKEVLPLLIAAGADLEIRDESGWTALISAAERNNTDAVRLLVRAGANLNAACRHAWTPLKLAVRNTNREMVRMLVGAGAEMCPQAQEYIDAMDRYIATVLTILPSDFEWELKKKTFDLVLAQHDGIFL